MTASRLPAPKPELPTRVGPMRATCPTCAHSVLSHRFGGPCRVPECRCQGVDVGRLPFEEVAS